MSVGKLGLLSEDGRERNALGLRASVSGEQVRAPTNGLWVDANVCLG